MSLPLVHLNVSGQTTLKETVIGSTSSDSTTNIVEKVNNIIDLAGTGGGEGGGISSITSPDQSINVTNPTGPAVQITVSGGGGGSYSAGQGISISNNEISVVNPTLYCQDTAYKSDQMSQGSASGGFYMEHSISWHIDGVDIVCWTCDTGGTVPIGTVCNNNAAPTFSYQIIGGPWYQDAGAILHVVWIGSPSVSKAHQKALMAEWKKDRLDMTYMAALRDTYIPNIELEHDFIEVDVSDKANLNDIIKDIYYFPNLDPMVNKPGYFNDAMTVPLNECYIYGITDFNLQTPGLYHIKIYYNGVHCQQKKYFNSHPNANIHSIYGMAAPHCFDLLVTDKKNGLYV